MMYRLSCITLLLVATSITGCGGGAEGGKAVFPTTGTVTMFGSPLANATVAFAPQEGQPTAFGKTDEAGNFTLTTYEYGDGAAEGNFKVVVSKSAPSQASDTSEGDDHDAPVVSHEAEMAKGEQAAGLVPSNYTKAATTPFTAEVKSGADNSFTFDIE